MKNDILKEYKILAVLGVPFFAVKNEEDRAELQAVVKLKLREVSNLTLIPEPDLSKAEEYLNDVDAEVNRLKECKPSFRRTIKKIRCIAAYVSLFSYFLVKHLVIRISFKKQICEEEIRMFAETTQDTIEYAKVRKIKKLAGIE